MKLRILVSRKHILQDYEQLRIERPQLTHEQLLHLAAQPYLLRVVKARVVQGIPIEILTPLFGGIE